MSDPVFARTRHLYDSYTDYWRLVELSGFPTCYVDEIDLERQGAAYIVSPVNGDFRAHMQVHGGAGRRARLIWWNLERPDVDGGPPLADVVTDLLRLVDEVWVSDRHYATLDRRQRFVVLGSHPALGEPPLPAAYDFTHQSYEWGRRCEPLAVLRSCWREGPNAWGAERDQVLRSSRLMVNLHQTAAPVGEPLRFALAGAYRLPLVTEVLADPFPLVEGVDFMAASIERIPQLVESAFVGDPAPMGERLHHRLCGEWTFRRGVEEALKAS